MTKIKKIKRKKEGGGFILDEGLYVVENFLAQHVHRTYGFLKALLLIG